MQTELKKVLGIRTFDQIQNELARRGLLEKSDPTLIS